MKEQLYRFGIGSVIIAAVSVACVALSGLFWLATIYPSPSIIIVTVLLAWGVGTLIRW